MAAQSTLRMPSPALSSALTSTADAVAASLDRLLVRAGSRLAQLRRTGRAARLVATLAMVAMIVLGSEAGRRLWRRRRHETETGRRLLRTNSFVHNKDGSRTIYVPYKSGSAKMVIHRTNPLTFEAHRRLFLNPPRVSGLRDLPSATAAAAATANTTTTSTTTAAAAAVPSAQTRPGINLAFLHQFLSLMSIAIPRWSSKEAGLLASHAVFLVLRTYLSLVVARLDGEIVRDLVTGQGRSFLWGIAKWLGLGGFASYTNAMIKFLESKVSIAFRTRLTRYIHDLYLNDGLNYYRLHNLDGGVGHGADQFVTQDLTLFCASAASLYSLLGKPAVDLCVFNYQLYRSLGPIALVGLLSNYFVTAIMLRRLAPPFGRLKAVEARREGEFRSLHARLIANAEEVAFYGGAEREKHFLQREFVSLKRWMEGIHMLKIRYNMLEDFILKYSWSAYGYVLSSLPVFLPAWGLGALSAQDEAGPAATGRGREQILEHGRMKDLITNKRLMLSLADAGGRIMYSIKDLAELAGYTSRVYAVIATLHRVHAKAYLDRSGFGSGTGHGEPFALSDVQGTMQRGFDGVRFENVPVVAPGLWPRGGELLIESLSMIVRRGDHLLISGSNGVGKSAIARILAGLWPVYSGLVSRPKATGEGGIMFLPQRPYLSVGTLRDQVTYPHSYADMRALGRTDSELRRVLHEARLGYLVEREGGWDTRKEWKDVLSGGEKQRIGFARLLYHEPAYAVVDEGTSAVSSDVEGLLYETCKQRGITLVTISTRASLKKYHVWNLVLGVGDEAEGRIMDEDGDGKSEGAGDYRSIDEAAMDSTGSGTGPGCGWALSRIGTAHEKLQVERELAELRERLGRVPSLRQRRDEIERELALP